MAIILQLFVRERRPQPEGRDDGVFVGDSQRLVDVGDGAVDEAAFEVEEVLGRVARSGRWSIDGSSVRASAHGPDRTVGRRLERYDAWVGEGLIGELFDDGDVGAGGEFGAPGAYDRAAIERAGLLGKSVRSEEPVANRLELVFGKCDGRLAEHGFELVAVPSDLGDLFGPQSAQQQRVHVVVLGLTGLEHRVLRGPGGGLTTLGQLGLDLVPSSREPIEHCCRDSDDVRDPVDDRCPLDTELDSELGAEVRFVEVAGGLGVEIEVPGVECSPAAVGAAGRVRDDDVTVQVRVAGSARAMPERRRRRTRRRADG